MSGHQPVSADEAVTAVTATGLPRGVVKIFAEQILSGALLPERDEAGGLSYLLPGQDGAQ